MPENNDEKERLDYLRKISAMSDHYGNKLVELMEKYGHRNLQEVTLQEAKTYCERMEATA